MRVDEYFERQYLTAGNTYDNFIFENCPEEFLGYAKKTLSKKGEDTSPCVVSIDREQEELLEKTLGSFNEDFQRQVLARDYVTASVVDKLLKYTDREQELKDFVKSQIQAFMQGDSDRVRDMHGESLTPYDVRRLSRRVGKIEVDFILNGTRNKFLQQAINLFVSSREPYSVKIFTSSKSLPTYYDTSGNLIECPHDYMRRDVNEFISGITTEKEK